MKSLVHVCPAFVCVRTKVPEGNVITVRFTFPEKMMTILLFVVHLFGGD